VKYCFVVKRLLPILGYSPVMGNNFWKLTEDSIYSEEFHAGIAERTFTRKLRCKKENTAHPVESTKVF
jgi:hypothetical protein